MKYKIYLLALLLLPLMIACNNPETINEIDPSLPAVIKVDSLYIRDTLQIAATDSSTVNKPNGVPVGEKTAFIYTAKMNVLYLGVDNPINIDLVGIAPKDIQVSISQGKIKGSGNFYIATPTTPGYATITVNGAGLNQKKYEFRVKPIPDPTARLSNKASGEMGVGEFKAQGGVGAFLDNFDFSATCQIIGFELTHIPRRQDPISVVNAGARYNDLTRRLVSNAKPGDIYIFTNVKSKCPGDQVSRSVNSMVFMIR